MALPLEVTETPLSRDNLRRPHGLRSLESCRVNMWTNVPGTTSNVWSALTAPPVFDPTLCSTFSYVHL